MQLIVLALWGVPEKSGKAGSNPDAHRSRRHLTVAAISALTTANRLIQLHQERNLDFILLTFSFGTARRVR